MEFKKKLHAIARALWVAPISQTRRGRYPNFDILRLLLAAEVAYAHIWYLSDPATFNWPGFVMAVPGFLAISGFLVLQSYAESGTWANFLKKRALRIVPALVGSLILVLLLFHWAGVLNSILNWISGGLYTHEGMANGPLWSLAWEEVAYFCLAIIWLAGGYKHPVFIWLLFIISVAFAATVRNWTSDPDIGIVIFLPVAFLIGNLMYLYRDSLTTTHPVIPWIMFFVMLQWRFTPYAQVWNGVLLLMLQAFSIVWAGMAGARVVPFRFPDISYSLYVYHYPIVLYLNAVLGIKSLRELTVISAATVIPLCLLSWYLVEKPALRLKKINILKWIYSGVRRHLRVAAGPN